MATRFLRWSPIRWFLHGLYTRLFWLLSNQSGEWFDEERRECEIWGSGSVPDGFWSPVESDVPVLLLTGSEDYITPLSYAERVATYLPNASVRVVPQRGHDDIDPCVAGLIENFLIQGRDTDPGLGCPEDTGPLPFELPGGESL